MRLPTISVCLALEKKKKGRQEQFAEREAVEQEMPFWIQSRVFDPEPSLGRSVSDQPSRPPYPPAARTPQSPRQLPREELHGGLCLRAGGHLTTRPRPSEAANLRSGPPPQGPEKTRRRARSRYFRARTLPGGGGWLRDGPLPALRLRPGRGGTSPPLPPLTEGTRSAARRRVPPQPPSRLPRETPGEPSPRQPRDAVTTARPPLGGGNRDSPEGTAYRLPVWPRDRGGATSHRPARGGGKAKPRAVPCRGGEAPPEPSPALTGELRAARTARPGIAPGTLPHTAARQRRVTWPEGARFLPPTHVTWPRPDLGAGGGAAGHVTAEARRSLSVPILCAASRQSPVPPSPPAETRYLTGGWRRPAQPRKAQRRRKGSLQSGQGQGTGGTGRSTERFLLGPGRSGGLGPRISEESKGGHFIHLVRIKKQAYLWFSGIRTDWEVYSVCL